MMAHWLADITKLFTAKSHNLADLARVVGYDPETFYQGTLSESEIRRRVLNTPIVVQEMQFEEFSGNLGLAIVGITSATNLRHPKSLSAIVFENEFELQEAYFQGKLDRDFAAVLRLSDYGQAKREKIGLLLPVMELLQAEGFDVAVLIDAIVTEAATSVPTAFNFAENASMGGRIGTIKDGDKIMFDWGSRRLDVVVTPVELEKRQLEPVATSPYAFGVGQSASETKYASLKQTIARQGQYLATLGVRFPEIRRKRNKISASYMNIFYNICLILNKALETEAFAPLHGDLDLAQALFEIQSQTFEFSKGGLSLRMYDTAIHGAETCLKISQKLRDADYSTKEGLIFRAKTFQLLGLIYAGREDSRSSIHAFKDAISELRESNYERDRGNQDLLAEIKRNLAKQLIAERRYENAYGELGEAEEALRDLREVADHPPRDIVRSLLRIHEDQVFIDRILDRPDEALFHANSAVALCESETRSEPLDRWSLDALARAYRLSAEAHELAREMSSSLKDLVASLSVEASALSVMSPSQRRLDRFQSSVRRLLNSATRYKGVDHRTRKIAEAIETKLGRESYENDFPGLMDGLLSLEAEEKSVLPDAVMHLRRRTPLEDLIWREEQRHLSSADIDTSAE
ncbi:dihydroxy-acid dehydratase domain-containing protein [Rhizobium hidalgonense]|uniref:dihydroxy-acid dehydratase domain-containing protein n=1 Tax=Rhizobium hidalgonense TaxID=1538159 RepID=UPI0028712D59|nr:dihydroxy-acid dehydratase [Rhizobium hidalgonense]MDR9804217.1 dihydroxy-acid dehydratase [Rhizobium hidalgonense]